MNATNNEAMAQKPAGVNRINLAGLGIKAKETKTKKEYPIMPEDGRVGALAMAIIARDEVVKEETAALKADKDDLACIASVFYFNSQNGKADVPSSVLVASKLGQVSVTFMAKYQKLPDDKALAPILGDKVGRFFRQRLDLEIDGDKLGDKVTDLLPELAALFDKHGVSDALCFKEKIMPVDDFHARRHMELTAAQNLAIHEVMPCTVMVKKKA